MPQTTTVGGDDQSSSAKNAAANLLALQSTQNHHHNAENKESEKASKGTGGGNKPNDLPMDISSCYAANTKYSSTGVPSDCGAIKYQDTSMTGEDVLTSVALQ